MASCECAGCGEHFTSVTPFDLHQRLDKGQSVCLKPAYIRNRKGELVLAVVRTKDGKPVWGKAGQDGRFSTSHDENERLSEGAAA